MAPFEAFGAAHALTEKKFEGDYNPVESSVTVGTSLVTIAPADPERVELVLVNHGGGTVYVGTTVDLTTNNGLPLAPNGGALILTVDEDADLVAVDMYAIAGSAGNAVFTLSVRRYGLPVAQGG